MAEIIETIKLFALGTPWYVYLIFLYLVFVGILALKGGPCGIAKLFIVPAIFLLLSIEELVLSFGLNKLYISAFGLGMLVGIVLGYLQYMHLVIAVDAKKKMVMLKGGASSLILLVVTFCYKYYAGYAISLNHSNVPTMHFAIILFISTIFTGAFVGRIILVMKKFEQVKHHNG